MNDSTAAVRSRWLWFPPVWVAALAGICLAFRHFFDDRGLFNTVVHASIALVVLGLAIWVVRRSGWPRRLAWPLAIGPTALVAAYFLQLLPFKMLNDGDAGLVGFRWRWNEPDRALKAINRASPEKIAWRETPQDFSRFLGGAYWPEVKGVELDRDWKSHPPKLLWRHEIGAGWSGFAVVGDYAVTQEARGDQEFTACYNASTGEPAWTHADPVRWDPSGAGALGGIGPRATPTIFEGRVYVQGAKGILKCLDAHNGELLWSHDTLAEYGGVNVMWGKACSPLIVDEVVVASVGAPGASLVAFDRVTGKEVWKAGERQSSYASPVLTELAGTRQIVAVNQDFITAHDAKTGAVLWEHPWPGNSDSDASTTQPMPVGGDRIFLSRGYGGGAELIQAARDDAGAWSAKTIWKNSTVMRTKMSNPVVRDGYVYGLCEGLMQCIELETGRSTWKKRRTPAIDHGQLLLVGDVMLAVTEKGGEAVLIAVNGEKYEELAHFDALNCDQCINWNTPALSGSRLLLRNDQQAACYELPLRHGPKISPRSLTGG